MIKVSFVSHDGTTHEVEAENGMSLMEAAVKNDIPGIDADCGGACACATCHVYLKSEWVERAGERSEMEEDMLDFAFDVRDESRLSCQINLEEKLDGLIADIPERQF